MLLRAVVEVPLERATVRIRGQDEPLPRCAELLDLEAQSIERFLRRLDVRKLQGDRPPFEDCQELSVIDGAASRGPAPRTTGCLPPGKSPAATVVPTTAAS